MNGPFGDEDVLLVDVSGAKDEEELPMCMMGGLTALAGVRELLACKEGADVRDVLDGSDREGSVEGREVVVCARVVRRP